MSNEYAEIAERFARDTAGHTMTVLHDDGLYRHLRFAGRPRGYTEYWFDLITTPYTLIFKGDGEAFVFAIDATRDMFDLFRKTSHHDGINPGYWSEKLASHREAARTYSQKLFGQEVARDLEAAEEDSPGIGAAWAEHVESEYNTEYEEEARRALDDFRFGESYQASCTKCDWSLDEDSLVTARRRVAEHTKEAGEKHTSSVRDLTFTFSDTWEWQLRGFDWWFLWACHAIAWGIARYDRVRSYGLQALAEIAASEAPLTVYRASHDSIAMGLYTTEAGAQKHCEHLLSEEYAATVALTLDWIGDEDDPEEPRELVVQVDGGDEQPTGYVITPLTVASAYDPEADV